MSFYVLSKVSLLPPEHFKRFKIVTIIWLPLFIIHCWQNTCLTYTMHIYWELLPRYRSHLGTFCPALRRQKSLLQWHTAVSANLISKQLLLFAVAWQCCSPGVKCYLRYEKLSYNKGHDSCLPSVDNLLILYNRLLKCTISSVVIIWMPLQKTRRISTQIKQYLM